MRSTSRIRLVYFDIIKGMKNNRSKFVLIGLILFLIALFMLVQITDCLPTKTLACDDNNLAALPANILIFSLSFCLFVLLLIRSLKSKFVSK